MHCMVLISHNHKHLPMSPIQRSVRYGIVIHVPLYRCSVLLLGTRSVQPRPRSRRALHAHSSGLDVDTIQGKKDYAVGDLSSRWPVSLTSLTMTSSQKIDMLQRTSIASILRLVAISYMKSDDLTCKPMNHVIDKDRS